MCDLSPSTTRIAVGVFKEHGYIPQGDPPGAEGTEGASGTQKVVNNRPLNFKATSGKTGKVGQDRQGMTDKHGSQRRARWPCIPAGRIRTMQRHRTKAAPHRQPDHLTHMRDRPHGAMKHIAPPPTGTSCPRMRDYHSITTMSCKPSPPHLPHRPPLVAEQRCHLLQVHVSE